MLPLCPVPKLNAPEVPGAATLIPKPPPPAGPADPPNVKGDSVVPPNTELPVPLLVVWVVAPKPEVVAAPKENTGVPLPKAGWVLAGVPKVEAAGFKPPKADCAALPKAGWAGPGAGVAAWAGAAEFAKAKELPKLGARAGLAGPCCCPSAAPNAGWGLAPGYDGGAGLGLEPKGMWKAGTAAAVVVKVRASGLLVAGAGVVRPPPKPPKPEVPLLLAAVCAAPGTGWPNVVAAVDAGAAGGLPNWKTEPMAGLKLAPEAGGAPKRKGAAAEVVVLVTLLTPKLNAGFEAESADVLAVLTGATGATAEAALAWPVKRLALVAVARAAV